MKEAVGKGRIPALVDADEHKGRLELEAARDVLTDPVLFKLFQLQLNRAREMYSVGQEPWCIRENETLLDHLARRQKAPESAVRWRKMREATFNECSVEAEILRYMTMHKSNGYERIQVKSRAYHKWRETAEMTLSCALEGLTETTIFCMFGWGCGCESWWASRGGEGEGGGALGSSHSGRTLDRNSSSTSHALPLGFLAG